MSENKVCPPDYLSETFTDKALTVVGGWRGGDKGGAMGRSVKLDTCTDDIRDSLCVVRASSSVRSQHF